MAGIIGSKIKQNYEVEAEIGAGGMGIVYRAKDLGSGELVAIKVIAAKALADPDRLKRFRNEARVTSSINHPGIVSVRDVGSEEIDGQIRDYIVMEFVPPPTLAERINGKPLPLGEALNYAIQIVNALYAAHAAGITHRDVKPSNVLIDPSGVVKLADFGLAKITELPPDPFAETGSVRLDLTQDGSIFGSFAYMSPEQARGQVVDHRSDIFSFGAVFYEMLSGKPAFDGATPVDKITSIIAKEPEEIPNLPLDLSVILMRCLRKDVNRRWQSAAELKSALEDIRLTGTDKNHSTIILTRTSNRRAWLSAAGGLAAGLAAVPYFAFRRPKQPSYQRLTFRNGDITGAKFAPGGLVAFTATWDGNPSSLFTCQPGNREPRPLGLPNGVLKGVTAASQAAMLFDSDNTLSIVSLGGGEPRPRLKDVLDADWAPNGESLAVVQSKRPGEFTIDYPIGTKRHESPQRQPKSLRVSPSGKEIAFFEFVPQAADYQVVILGEDSKPRIISSGWRAVGSLLWSPKGDEIWMSGTRANQDPAVFALTMAGKERVVTQTPDWLYLHDSNPRGEILVAPTQSRLSIRIGGVGREEQSHSWLDSSVAYDISADDKFVLFAELGYATGRNPYIYIRNLDGSPARRIGEGNRPALSPDNKWVVCTRSVGADYRIAIIPNGPGDDVTRPIEGWSFEVADWMPDSSRLLAFAHKGQEPSATYLLDAKGAPGRRITPLGVRAIKASPDGLLCAGVEAGQIRVYPIDERPGQSPRVVTPSQPAEAILRWTPEGIFSRHRTATRTTIDRIDVTSGRRTRIFDLPVPEAGANLIEPTVLSRSARVYAFTYQRDIASLYLATGLQ